MLRIIKELSPFCEDNYRRIHVREYARIMKISPPSASKLLEAYRKENLLKMQIDKRYSCYFANREDHIFNQVNRMYWESQLQKAGLINFLTQKLLSPVVILFGSLSKAEAKPDSDLDLAVFSPSKNQLDLNIFEKKIKKKIQIFLFKNQEEVKNKELLNNILNGFILEGSW